MEYARKTTPPYMIEKREDGICTFTVMDSSRQTVDAIFDGLEQVVAETATDDVVLFLLDGSLSHLNPPLSYTFQRAKDFMRRHAVPPRRRVAVLYTNGLLVSLLDTFLSSLTGYNSDFSITRFFKADQMDEAVQWLLSNRPIQR